MLPRVTLKFTAGPLREQEFVFRESIVCTIGRSHDCLLQLRGSDGSLTVSRRHCLLDIRPPDVRIRDLKSRNGTFVNGRQIAVQDQEIAPEMPELLPEVELHDGDRIRVGDSEFIIEVEIAHSENGHESDAIKPSNFRSLACC